MYADLLSFTIHSNKIQKEKKNASFVFDFLSVHASMSYEITMHVDK